MAKKIVSVFLAILLLVIALFMAANLVSDLIIRGIGALECILGGSTLMSYHYYYQGHALHVYGGDYLTQNILNNQSYFQSEFLCFIATTISSWANFAKNASSFSTKRFTRVSSLRNVSSYTAQVSYSLPYTYCLWIYSLYFLMKCCLRASALPSQKCRGASK